MSLTAPERETIITLNDEDETADIWTAQRPWITRLKKNPSATLLEEGKHDGSAWARFQIDKSLIQARSRSRKGPGPVGAREATALRRRWVAKLKEDYAGR